MTRRIVRTICQVATVTITALVLVFFLDRNYRVLPTAIHEYMPSHHPGLVVTDITIVSCSSINPFSSCRLDPEAWHRVEKDLYLGKGLFSSAFLHVRRMKEEEMTVDDAVVVDVSVGRLDPGKSGKASSQPHRRAATAPASDERWESRPAGLWIKRSSKRHISDSKQAVTAVDVLFGEDAVEARDGWAIRGTPLLLDGGGGAGAVHITVRTGGAPHEPVKPQPRVHDNGKFKIVQLADLHLSTGVGVCRDAVPDGYKGGECEADPRTLDFVSRVLEDEKPDLVVLSGDQVNGETAPDAQSAIFKYAQLLIKHKIPYVSIFGNHDDEGSLPRSAQMALIESLPYSLSKAGPDDVDGVGNYYVEVLARGKSSHSAITVYLLDTHAYSPDERKFRGYDWIKPNQIEWFRQTAQGLKHQHKEYTHVHMDVAFIHIPLPEYRNNQLYFKGPWKEPPTAPAYNSGFRDALVEQGVVMVSCGHDHVNEYCMLSTDEREKPALWMCYAGGAGFGGYAGYGGFYRKIRVFDFDMNAASITTWKRTEFGEVDKRIDEQVIVSDGKPVAPME
ncbi:hypothetical protein VTK73DRAFT_1600 [Phialemonium thermophilum]|uniref:Calcineurin-like phosphoesterase domain-containing protein n=1 Tax=Phialemonium thermophilum TaxID=223376 RepID=A0ABR3Y4C1_9PEZI